LPTPSPTFRQGKMRRQTLTLPKQKKETEDIKALMSVYRQMIDSNYKPKLFSKLEKIIEDYVDKNFTDEVEDETKK